MQIDDPNRGTKYVLSAIMAGLVVWGVFHAVGAFRYNYNPWRGVIVLGCVAVFLGWWLILLNVRSRRAARIARPENEPEE
jgi:protein-S-isoprenylcysteine O-methyltransferase Ste14